MVPLGVWMRTLGTTEQIRRLGVEDMIPIKEVCMTVMETMRLKEKPSHNCFTVIPLFVPQLLAAFSGLCFRR